MDEKQETAGDIIAEMRDRKEMLVNAISSAPLCYPVDDMKAKVEILDEFIDRLEAAHNREVKAITTKLEEARHCWKVWSDRADELKNKCNEQYANLKTAGNGAKMREALEAIVKGYEIWDVCDYVGWGEERCKGCPQEALCKAIFDGKNAIAAPRRNCGVGTAEEQGERFSEFCDRYGRCEDCPIGGIKDRLCASAWAQMPYESEVKK